jgi:hypothetical protein
MVRSVMIVLAAVVLPAASKCEAQTEIVDLLAGQQDPFDYWKAIARAKSELRAADAKKLAAARWKALCGEVAARVEEFHQWRGTLEFMLDSGRGLVDAGRSVFDAPGDRLAVLEWYEDVCRALEVANQGRFDRGQIPIQYLLETRFARLEAELWLKEARRELGGTSGGRPFELTVIGVQPLEAKELAKGKWAARNVGPQSLGLAKVETARRSYHSREQEFLAGRGTLNFMLQASRRLLESEQAAVGSDERRSALERYWQRSRMCEAVNAERSQAGRISFKDYAETIYARQDAEVAVARGRKFGERPRIPGEPAAPIEDNGPFGAKELAKAKRHAAFADAAEAARARLQAAEIIWYSRVMEFLAGRGTLPFVLDAARKVLDAENDIRPGAADRLAALARYWEKVKLVETVNEERYLVGHIPFHDYLESRERLLEAGLWLRQAESK